MSENINNENVLEEQQQLTLQDLWTMCAARWPWFLGAVVACLAIAALYISSQPPVFSSSAYVLIKENSKNASIGDVSQTFTQLGFGTARVNVYNEIISFQSPDLMVEVAKRLSIHFPTFIRWFHNGVAQVDWQLNPDGRYYQDDDGYGMTDDEEIEIYGFIDTNGNVLVKFRAIKDSSELETMRKEADDIVRNRTVLMQ